MDYEKIGMDGYDAYILKTNKYTTMKLSFMFEIENTKKNIFSCDVLSEYILNTSSIYKSKKELVDKLRELYNIRISIDTYHVGAKLFTELHISLIDPKLVGDDEYYRLAMEFVESLIFKPKLTLSSMDREEFATIKKKYINQMSIKLDDPSSKENIFYTKSIFKDTFLDRDLIESKEEFEELMDDIKEKDIIKLYDTIINDSFVGASLLGNFDDEQLGIIRDKFKFKIHPLDENYRSILPFDEPLKVVEVSNDTINESTLKVVYKINNYQSQDSFIYSIIAMSLSYTGMMLHKKLREELHLVYNTQAYYNDKGGFLEVTAYIDKNNRDRALKGIDSVIEEFNSIECIEEMILKCQKQYEINEFTLDESVDRMFNRMVKSAFAFTNIKNIEEGFKKVTPDMIKMGLSNLEKKAIFLYRGDKSE